MAGQAFTVQSFLLRLVFAALLVGGTYNPEGVQSHWVEAGLPNFGAGEGGCRRRVIDWLGGLLVVRFHYSVWAGWCNLSDLLIRGHCVALDQPGVVLAQTARGPWRIWNWGF